MAGDVGCYYHETLSIDIAIVHISRRSRNPVSLNDIKECLYPSLSLSFTTWKNSSVRQSVVSIGSGLEVQPLVLFLLTTLVHDPCRFNHPTGPVHLQPTGHLDSLSSLSSSLFESTICRLSCRVTFFDENDCCCTAHPIHVMSDCDNIGSHFRPHSPSIIRSWVKSMSLNTTIFSQSRDGKE